MTTRSLVGFLAVTALALILPAASVQAGPNNYRYVDASERLPADTNPADTDTFDVDFVDVDGDGDLDIFVAEGTATVESRPNKLYINDGTGVYADESQARLPTGPPANSVEVEFADVDDDGDLDAIVANLGPEQLLLNDGDGFFSDASGNLPGPFQDISAEARFADVDGDGDPDILVSNENPFNPSPLGGVQNRIWINNGAGRFTDETDARLPARTDQTQGFVPGDIDADGDLDLIVINVGQDFVLVNDGSGHFTDETAARFPVTTDASRKGVLADFNGDGTLDLFVANSRNQQNRLYFNEGGVFVDVTKGHVPRRADTTTSVAVADLDDDGDLDIYLTNAGDFRVNHGFLGDVNVFLRNNGVGRFHDKTSVHFFPQVSRPGMDAEFGDVDGDGDLDLLLGNSTSIGGAEALYLRRPARGRDRDDR